MITAEDIYRNKQIDFALSRISQLPTEIEIPLPSEWAEENRILPPGTSDYYGPMDFDVVPHLRQPLDDCHPDSPYTHITNMKSVQSANTTTLAENLMGFFIRYKLGSILFLTSTKGMAGIRGSSNIDVMIDHSGLAEYLKPASNRTGKKTKDNTLYKEFAGGTKLLMTSYNSIADLKSNTFHLIVEDELDEAGTELKDQGDIEGIIEGRTMGLMSYKILQISTSSRAETSRIYRNFLRGDQNEYHVPCPKCGELQTLVLKGGGEEYGLTFTRETSKRTGKKVLIPETIRYICRHCKEDFRESKKHWMLNNGIWIPQAEPEDRKRRSYHSPGLISPFLSWERICQSFIDTKFGEDLLKFKDFTINVLGNPWKAVKKTASWEMLRNRAEDYCFGEIPPGEGKETNINGEKLFVYYGPQILYAGVDVQADRLEMMVTGFGPRAEKTIVDYQIFYGDTSDLDSPAWIALDDFAYSKTYKLGNYEIPITLVAIDSGWDPRKGKRGKDFAGKSNIVYDFVSQREDMFIAIMGVADENTTTILKESRISDVNTMLTKKYNVSVSLLKESLMAIAEQKEGHGTVHVPRFIMVNGKKKPKDDEWYRQFLSERYQEVEQGKMGWVKIYKRNEPLDTFNYSIAAAEYHNVSRWSLDVWADYYSGLIEG